MQQVSNRQEFGIDLGRLSDIVIEALKEISSQRRVLASSSLCDALRQRQDLLGLVSAMGRGNGTSPHSDAGAYEIQALQQENGILRSQKERFFNHVVELQDEKLNLQAFYKRSLLTLLNWIQTPGQESFPGSLNDFKILLMKDSSLGDLQKSLNTITEHLAYQNGVGGSDKEAREDSASSWGKWLRNKKLSPEPPVSDHQNIKQLQEVYLEVLDVIAADSVSADLSSLSGLQEKIKAVSDPAQLNAIRKEFLAFIESSIKNITEERKQLTAFVSEIGENLIRMESHLFHSLDSNRRSHEANRDFNNIIEVQMADMKQSVSHSTTLGELKNLVVTKISTICLALEAKRQEDERRLHEADEKVGDLQGTIEKVKAEIDQVQERARNLERQALIDPLTNSYNRRAYEQRLKEEFQRYQRYEQSFSLLLLDVDNFKNVNDRYGHSAGDLCLREVIQRVRSLLRVPDFLARFGGDEMVVILPGTGREEMKVVAEKIHSTIERTRFFYQGKQIPIRVSVGGTQIEGEDRSGTDVFNRADKALYAAKSAGRNNVTVF